MRKFLDRTLRAAAAAAAALLCAVAPAQAAFYSGEWDPLYGLPFVGSGSIGYDLGWRGEVQVFVPDACANASGIRNYGLASSCAQGSYIQSATVDLYDATTSEAKGTLSFSTAAMSVLALHFNGSQLLSLATLPSSWEQATLSLSPPVAPFFSLLFVDPAYSGVLRALGFSTEIPSGYAGPLLLSHPTTDLDNLEINDWPDLLRAIMTISQIDVSDVASEEGRPTYPNGGFLFGLAAAAPVPEPGSLALVALALVLTGWFLRKRPAGQAQPLLG